MQVGDQVRYRGREYTVVKQLSRDYFDAEDNVKATYSGWIRVVTLKRGEGEILPAEHRTCETDWRTRTMDRVTDRQRVGKQYAECWRALPVEMLTGESIMYFSTRTRSPGGSDILSAERALQRLREGLPVYYETWKTNRLQ